MAGRNGDGDAFASSDNNCNGTPFIFLVFNLNPDTQGASVAIAFDEVAWPKGGPSLDFDQPLLLIGGGQRYALSLLGVERDVDRPRSHAQMH